MFVMLHYVVLFCLALCRVALHIALCCVVLCGIKHSLDYYNKTTAGSGRWLSSSGSAPRTAKQLQQSVSGLAWRAWTMDSIIKKNPLPWMAAALDIVT